MSAMAQKLTEIHSLAKRVNTRYECRRKLKFEGFISSQDSGFLRELKTVTFVQSVRKGMDIVLAFLAFIRSDRYTVAQLESPNAQGITD